MNAAEGLCFLVGGLAGLCGELGGDETRSLKLNVVEVWALQEPSLLKELLSRISGPSPTTSISGSDFD